MSFTVLGCLKTFNFFKVLTKKPNGGNTIRRILICIEFSAPQEPVFHLPNFLPFQTHPCLNTSFPSKLSSKIILSVLTFPERISLESSFNTSFCITRFTGLAPKCGS